MHGLAFNAIAVTKRELRRDFLYRRSSHSYSLTSGYGNRYYSTNKCVLANDDTIIYDYDIAMFRWERQAKCIWLRKRMGG